MRPTCWAWWPKKWMKLNDNASYEEAWEALNGMQPISRKGSAEEIARWVLFLASGKSSLMTGAELVLDGGWTAK